MINRYPIFFRCLVPIVFSIMLFVGLFDILLDSALFDYDAGPFLFMLIIMIPITLFAFGSYQFGLLKKQCPSCRKWNAAIIIDEKIKSSNIYDDNYQKTKVVGDSLKTTYHTDRTISDSYNITVECKKCKHQWNYSETRQYYKNTTH